MFSISDRLRPARRPVLRTPHSPTSRHGRVLLALTLACVLPSPGARAQADQQVLVQATRFAQPRDELPFGVSVLTADDLRQTGATTVNEAVMKLLGVPGRQDFYGGGNYGLDLRGFGTTAEQNQVVILDGVRLSENDLSSTRLSGIPIETVERIEVVRGSAAVLYGDGATGGAIVITTRARNGTAAAPRSSLYGAVGSRGLRELRATGSVGSGPWSFDLAAQQREADNQRDNFHSNVRGASVGTRWQGDGLRLGARLAADDLKTGLPGALTAAQFAANPRQTNRPVDRAAIRNVLALLTAQADVAGWQLAADAGWREKALRSVNVPFTYDYDVRSHQQSLRAQRRFDGPGGAHAFSAGVDREHWTRQVLGAFGFTAEQASLGLYLRDELTLAGGTRLSLGGRHQRLDKQTGTVAQDSRLNAWDLGLTQPLGRGWAAFARTGRSFRTANADEYTFTANSQPLRPQTSRDHDLGLRWADAASRAELRAYRSALRDEIGYDPAAPGPFGPGANANFAPTRRQGLELEAAHRWNPQWQLGVVAARRQSRFVEGPYAGRDVPLTPHTSVSLRADWQPAAGHRVDAVLRHVGPQHPTFANTCTMPSYSTVDLRYARQWGDLEAAIALFNLADRRYTTQAFGCTVGGQPTSLYPEAGRSATASLRWWF